MGSEADEDGIDLFQEPDDFYEKEKEATFETHKLLSGEEITVRLVGHNPLWGHHLWQAGRLTSTYLERHAPTLLHNKSVLELGAGAGLPSLISALNSASTVVVTDYPDADLIANLNYNIEHSLAPFQAKHDSKTSRIVAEGYLWGADPSPLLSHLPATTTTDSTDPGPAFDVLILADLLFNHSEHSKLLSTIRLTLSKSPSARAYVFFTPYRPWLLEKDLAFFDLAREGGFRVEKLFEEVLERVMFEGDPGDERLRRTVFGYEMRWEEGRGNEV